MQERRNARLKELRKAGTLVVQTFCLPDGLVEGQNECHQSCLIRYRNECSAVLPQGSRQSEIQSRKPDSIPARKRRISTVCLKACNIENKSE